MVSVHAATSAYMTRKLAGYTQAGGFSVQRTLTADGWESNFGANHLAHHRVISPPLVTPYDPPLVTPL